MRIKAVVDRQCRQYGTRDPFEIARHHGIIVVVEQLGTIRGYYSRSYRQRVIHINNGLCWQEQAVVCAHELGHAILHPQANTPFLKNNTFLSVDKLEMEANRFACHLLLPDDRMSELLEYTVPQIANMCGLTESIVEYRLKTMNSQMRLRNW